MHRGSVLASARGLDWCGKWMQAAEEGKVAPAAIGAAPQK
jgi:hypothetical protein